MTVCRFCLYSVITLPLTSLSAAQEWKSGVEWQQPPIVTPGTTNDQPPSDAIVLFGGRDLSAFENGDQWLVQEGIAIPRQQEIVSKQHFGDIQLHLEWSAPAEIKGNGQGRGNSGVYLMEKYEVQILDSFENPTYFDGQAGSVYKQTPPMANAMRKPGEWNTYDIFFTAPRFKVNGDVETPGYVTLIHNGVLALNHFELLGSSSYVAPPRYEPHAETGPISLQFHGDLVRFRNIWLRELKPAVGKRTSAGFNIVKEPAREPEPETEEASAQKAVRKSDDSNDSAAGDK
ncbi:MAG: DUF1080 domain-containing protein [Fuerstiella sp.]|nr:DUF1080 domain-containing protein [Fuerstiella sp.]MCP4507233.1 DUF1080 domain-containing protein [Fuerstiella sp.]